LMEQYGIYYFFEHRDQQHTMVLADSTSSHAKIPDLQEKLRFLGTPGQVTDEQHFHSWTSGRRFRTGKITLKDYDYCSPPNDLHASQQGSENYQYATFEVYDYPGKYDNKDKGGQFAKYRLDAEQAIDHGRTATGIAPSLFPGGLVTIEEPTISAENTD